eukprot:scaffold47929_cov56-Phaeocystis_antarctica.AAC.1
MPRGVAVLVLARAGRGLRLHRPPRLARGVPRRGHGAVVARRWKPRAGEARASERMIRNDAPDAASRKLNTTGLLRSRSKGSRRRLAAPPTLATNERTRGPSPRQYFTC